MLFMKGFLGGREKLCNGETRRRRDVALDKTAIVSVTDLSWKRCCEDEILQHFDDFNTLLKFSALFLLFEFGLVRVCLRFS